jgi:hypothetical protein
MEGHRSGIIWGTISAFAYSNWGKPRKPQSRHAISGPIFQPGPPEYEAGVLFTRGRSLINLFKAQGLIHTLSATRGPPDYKWGQFTEISWQTSSHIRLHNSVWQICWYVIFIDYSITTKYFNQATTIFSGNILQKYTRATQMISTGREFRNPALTRWNGHHLDIANTEHKEGAASKDKLFILSSYSCTINSVNDWVGTDGQTDTCRSVRRFRRIWVLTTVWRHLEKPRNEWKENNKMDLWIYIVSRWDGLNFAQDRVLRLILSWQRWTREDI